MAQGNGKPYTHACGSNRAVVKGWEGDACARNLEAIEFA